MFRVNKCLPKSSRREADRLIKDGYVYINNIPAKPGDMINYGDKLEVKGNLVNWEKIMKLKNDHSIVIPFNCLI